MILLYKHFEFYGKKLFYLMYRESTTTYRAKLATIALRGKMQ